MSTHNICFYGELTKIILQLSSNTGILLICSTEIKVSYKGRLQPGAQNFMHWSREFTPCLDGLVQRIYTMSGQLK